MKKKTTLLTLWAVLFALCAAAGAQQPTKIYRIGYLSNVAEIRKEQEQVFRQALHDLGYIEGHNFLIAWRFAKGKLELLPNLAAELIRLDLDCIVASGVAPTRAVKEATSTIPIIMANADDDPIRHGLVASLARPGGNVTGFTNIGSDLAGKRLELLKETVPKASRVAILWDPRGAGGQGHIRESELVAPGLGIQLQPLAVRVSEELESRFQAAANERADGLIVVTTALMNSLRARIVNLALKTRLPAMYSAASFALAGGLMSYADDPLERSRRVAAYVDNILKGTKPGDLPVQQPTKFEFVINLKTARQIGLTIPPNVLARADRVIR
jgi:putative ABC transport system substrate-binding protein